MLPLEVLGRWRRREVAQHDFVVSFLVHGDDDAIQAAHDRAT